MANLMLENQESLFDYFHVYMPAPPATQLSRTITNWSKHKGCEWTVGQLKAIKTQLLNFYGGNPISLVKSKNGIAVGPFAYLFKIGLEKAMRTIHVYTSFISPRMTHKQKLKFVDAVECQFDGNIRSVKLTEDFGRVLIRHLKRSRNLNIYTFFDGKQRAPHIVNGKLRTIPETELNPANLIQDFVDVSEANRRLCMRHVGLIAETTELVP